MKEYGWLIEYNLLDLLKYYLFVRFVFDIRMKKEKVFLPIWLTVSIGGAVVYYFVRGFGRELFLAPVICSLLLIVFVHKKDRLKSALSLVLSWIIMDTLSEVIRVGLFALCGDGIFLDRQRFGGTLAQKCIVLAIPIIYHVVVNIVMKKKIDYSFLAYQWGLILISFVGLLIIIPSLEKILTDERFGEHEYVVIIMALIAFFFLFIGVMLWQSYIMKKNMALQEEENRYIFMLKAQEKYFDGLRKRDEDIRKFRHDFCAHMAVIRKYLEQKNYEKMLEYLKDIEKDTGVGEKMIYTGNMAVDAVINDQVNNMADKSIRFNFDGFFNVDEEISDFDLCTIFYNLIKNAVEGCEKVTSGGRKVSVKIKNIGERLGIVIENDTVLEELPDNCVIPTSKEDKKNHGFGMKSVKAVIEKYNGIYQNSIEDGKFVVNVVI